MTLGMLLLPHANARYFHSIKDLSLAELSIMNSVLKSSSIEYRSVGGLELLCADFESMDEARVLPILERHSSCQAVFSIQGDLLRPLIFPGSLRYDGDISAILKYKGKTNERFTALLINAAVFSGAFSENYGDALHLFDPMCGRGTTLLEGLRRGYHVSGIDIDKADSKELNQYLLHYLQYHKVKHTIKKDSMTRNGKPAGGRTRVTIDGVQSYAFVHGDTRDADAFYQANSFEAIAVDLPYGIQHRSLAGKTRTQIDALMREALPRWRELLKPGGAIALSFNAHNVSLTAMRAMLEDTGYRPLTGGPYDGFRHWVEQAVDRDVAIAIRQ